MPAPWADRGLTCDVCHVYYVTYVAFIVPEIRMPITTIERLTRREREIVNAVFAPGNRASAEEIRARFTAAVVLVAIMSPITLVATPQETQPAFAVASIKLHAPENPGEGMRIRPDGIDYSRVTLFECIREAYHVAGFQISEADRFGGAMLSKRYDIIAKAEKHADKTELMSMLQTLLPERFKLQLHRETNELPVFLLIAGKKGPRLTAVADDGPSSFRLGPEGASFKRTSLESLAEFLSGLGSIQRPVLDRTSLSGVFDFTLLLSDHPADAGAPVDKRAIFAWSSIREDLKDLGLTIESSRAPVEFLVVDHAEDPSDN